jgi:Xaa-Pro aminopeptidase
MASHLLPKFNPATPLSHPLPPLLYTDTHASADLLYFGRVEVHDPFIAFGTNGKKITVQSALEFGRVKRTGDFDVVLPREAWLEKARARYGRKAGVAEMIACLAKEYRVRGFRVADDFSAGLYLRLRRLGVRLELAKGALFPEREIKAPWEAEAVREGNRLCSVGYAVAEKILRATRVQGRTLAWQGRPLTSERLRCAIEVAIKEQGGEARDTIVAGGDQACDPHERGAGPLRPHELIIVDIFPRVVKTGYHGDMTRTYLKGRASEAQKKLVATVLAAQRAAIRLVTAGRDGRDVHELVQHVFTEAGYETKHGRNGSVGFIHGTGHGLGLAVHDPGRLGPVSAPIKLGAVLTVEPGLYYPGLGGCRWEDVVQVTQGSPKMLSHHPYNWEIR